VLELSLITQLLWINFYPEEVISPVFT